MKFKKYASNKTIAIILAVIISFGGIFGQHNKIKSLEGELYKQQNAVEQRWNYSSSEVDLDTIQNEVNNMCDYKIMSGTINMKHTYIYERDGFLGMNHTSKLVGTADLYYELITSLQEAAITEANDKRITIEVNYPRINEDSVHRVNNTFVRMDQECDNSLLSNKKDVETATRHWEDTFDTKGYITIKNAYETGYKEKQVTNATIEQVRNLFRELGYYQYVSVKFR